MWRALGRGYGDLGQHLSCVQSREFDQVELAIRQLGQRRRHEEMRRPHRCGQMVATPTSQTFLGDGALRCRGAIGDEHRARRHPGGQRHRPPPRSGRRARTASISPGCTVLPTDLDLAIPPAIEFEQPVRQKPTEITGPVTGHARKFRRGAEASSSECLVPPITERQRRGGNKDFPDLAGSDGRAILANQFQLKVLPRVTDRHQRPIKRCRHGLCTMTHMCRLRWLRWRPIADKSQGSAAGIDRRQNAAPDHR